MAFDPDEASRRGPPHLSRADSEALGRRRRGRNLALLAALIGLAALFYFISIAKLSHPDAGRPVTPAAQAPR